MPFVQNPFNSSPSFYPNGQYSNYNSHSDHYHFKYNSQYGLDSQSSYQKYFPKQYTQTLPGMSNIPSSSSYSEQMIINPLKNPEIKRTNYHKSSQFSTYSDFSNTNNYQKYPKMSQKLTRYDNPFQKKYLLDSKNYQLQDYIESSQYSANWQNIDYKRKTKKEYNSLKSNIKSQQEQVSQHSLGQGMKRLTQKYGNSHKYKVNDKHSNYVKANQGTYNYKYGEHIDSDQQIDEKEFQSFGKGQKNKSNNYQKVEEERQPSLINGVTNLVSEKYIEKQHTVKQQQPLHVRIGAAYINSDSQDNDYSHASGTFKIPDAIINELNRQETLTKIPLKGNNAISHNAITDSQHRKNQHGNNNHIHQPNSKLVSESYNVQVNGKNPNKDSRVKFNLNKNREKEYYPNRLSVKGKNYEKLDI